MSTRAILEAQIARLTAELQALPHETVVVPPVYLTVAEYAARIQVSARTLRRLLAEGLPVLRPRPRLVRIAPAVADAWLTARARSATVAAMRGTVS